MSHTITEPNHSYIVIMAGGSGTRLWPLSRINQPKQFQAFTSEKTLIQETVSRAETVVPQNNIFISTGAQYISTVHGQLPAIDSDHLIIEPIARNTAPAIIYAALLLAHRDPEAIIATIPSDHAIKNQDEFTRSLALAFDTVTAHPQSLVTLGIHPTHPDTGYGYICLGNPLTTSEANSVFSVAHFKEKPDRATAETYLASGQYLWNAGYFIFRASMIQAWVRTYAPELISFTETARTLIENTALHDQSLLDLFTQTDSLPIDTVLAERLPETQRFVIKTSLQWSDIGGWDRLFTFLSQEQGRDIVATGPHLDHGSEQCLIHGNKRLIVTDGLQDIIIVDTDDALLVANRNTLPQNIKKLLSKLPEDIR